MAPGGQPKVATITQFFSVTTREAAQEERRKVNVQLQEKFKEQAARKEEAERQRLAAKRPVGRPKKAQAQPVLVPPVAVTEPPAANGDEQGQPEWVPEEERPPPAKKPRGSYTNWFVPNLWPFIEAAVKQHPKNLYDALNSLQHIRKPGRLGSPFDKLTLSTLKGWYERDVTGHFILRRKYEEAIKA